MRALFSSVYGDTTRPALHFLAGSAMRTAQERHAAPDGPHSGPYGNRYQAGIIMSKGGGGKGCHLRPLVAVEAAKVLSI